MNSQPTKQEFFETVEATFEKNNKGEFLRPDRRGMRFGWTTVTDMPAFLERAWGKYQRDQRAYGA